MAEDVRRQLEEISGQPDRAQAYAGLLHLQRRCVDDPAAMAALSSVSNSFLPRILYDARRPDEEIAAQAMKCLGFTLYHPSLVATISEGDAGLVLESLAKLIMTTRMKVVCNLGVWCVSIQQLSSEFIESYVGSVLRAVVHALDNPYGSLSTTFEAMQALVKLSTQLCEKMREMSYIWIPPLYRRLISANKRERDIAGRCLLKMKSNIHPPPLDLSKAIASDLKKKLLPRMMDMLQSDEQKVYIVHAWGWYIYFLGSHALSNKHLVNEMLKIPEQTFRDPDPQVQIASLISWESLVDALLPPWTVVLEKNVAQAAQVHRIQQTGSDASVPLMRNYDDKVDGLLKRIKVIMLPLQGIVSSSCDVSVRSACLNTWHYLLHKLDFSVNHPAVLTITFESILEVVFSKGPDRQSISLWSLCLYLFDEYILAKLKIKEMSSTGAKNFCYVENSPTSTGSFGNSRGLLMDYPIKWLPWEIGSLNFHLKMIGCIVSQRSMKTANTESTILVLNSALRIFRSVLQGVQAEWSAGSTPYDSAMLCINTVLKFVKELCEDMVSEQNANHCSNFTWTALQFVEAIREELEPSILESPLYRVNLDLKYINNLQCSEDSGYPNLGGLGIRYLTSADMVSPMVYTTVLYLCVVAESDLKFSQRYDILSVMQNSKFGLFTCNCSVNLHSFICFLYMHIREPTNGRLRWLTRWSDVAKGLKENIDRVHNISFLKAECDDSGYNILYWFLCYPFLFFFPKEKVVALSSSTSVELCLVSLHRELELESVMEVWRSLFDALNHVSQTGCSVNNFVESLSESLIKVLHENGNMLEGNIEFCLKEKAQNVIVLATLGEIVIHILNQNQASDLFLIRPTQTYKQDSNHKLCSPIKNSLDLVARFLRLALIVVKANPQAEHEVINRAFVAMATFIRRLCLKQDILLLMEAISDPVVQWLSSCATIYGEMQQGSTIGQLRCLWEEVLDCLRRSQPPIGFNPQFLEVQGSLLQIALDHPDSSISDATVAFWRATYGQKANLHYTPCLVPVLHKLSRSGRINIPKENRIIIKNNDFSVKEAVDVSKRHTMPIVQKRALSKETEIAEACVDVLNVGLGRKRFKVTKKTVEVKGALENVPNDFHGNSCNSANAKFSASFSYSLERQELREPKYILEMLRRGK